MLLKFTRLALVFILLFALAGCKSRKKKRVTPQSAPVENLGIDLSFNRSYSVNERAGASAKEYMNRHINNGVHSSELMMLSSGLASFLAMYDATDSIKYLDMAYEFTNRILNSARVSSEIQGNQSPFKDKYQTWVNLNPKYEQTKVGSPHMKEYPLYESYYYRYMAKMLYMTSQLPNRSKNNYQSQYTRVLNFLKVDGWEKWYERGLKESVCYPFLFRSRAHMTAHWATVAMYLNELVDEPARNTQYTAFLNLYNAQLRDNLRVSRDNAYIWNQTWDSNWPLGTTCNKPSKGIIQDGSHGNHVIAYVVEGYELGKYWSKQDISRFVQTVKTLLYNPSQKFFYGDFNKKIDDSFAAGLRFGDGFLKLARYDDNLFHIFESVRKAQQNKYHYRYEEPQYVAEYLLAKKYYKN